MEKLNDQVVQRMRIGDEHAFNIVFDSLYSMVMLHAEKFVRTEIAEEVTAESFLKIWQRRADFYSLPQLRKFLLVVARNISIDFIRGDKTKKWVSTEGLMELYEEEDRRTGIYYDVLKNIEQAINLLPPQQREVIIRAYTEGLNTEEIAVVMRLSSQTVRNYKKIALDKLRVMLRPVDYLFLLLLISRI